MNQTIRILPTSEMDAAQADIFIAAAREAIVRSGRFTVALNGGNTPCGAYRLLAEEPRRDQIDWSKVHIFWGDERNVPASDPNSNEGMARDAFLDKVPIPANQIHPMYIGGTNEEAAKAYETLLKDFFNGSSSERDPDSSPVTRHSSPDPSLVTRHSSLGEAATFDLLMLGMGPDGHTLSLFPGANNLDSEKWVIATETDVWAVHDRITITALVVSLARQAVFEIEGADKAANLKAILEDQAQLPTGVVAERAREVIWLVDEAAASELSVARPH